MPTARRAGTPAVWWFPAPGGVGPLVFGGSPAAPDARDRPTAGPGRAGARRVRAAGAAIFRGGPRRVGTLGHPGEFADRVVRRTVAADEAVVPVPCDAG